jgi:hypothetical protein
MSPKYILKIQTNNLFLRNKYKQFENKEVTILDLYCPKNLTVTNISTIDFDIRCKMINTETDLIEPLIIKPNEENIKEPLKVEHMMCFVDPTSCDASLLYKVTKVPKSQDPIINMGDSLFQLIHSSAEKFTVKVEFWISLSCCKFFNSKKDDDDDDLD